MDYQKIANSLPYNQCFSKIEIVNSARDICNEAIKESCSSWLVNQMIQLGFLIKAGRNQYVRVEKSQNLRDYEYQPSEYMNDIVSLLTENFPLLKFQAWEAFQFNYFVNHQLAHNTVFIEVESMLENSVFEFLQDKYAGNVLLKPGRDTFQIYARDNTIVVTNMISETPVNKKSKYLITMEKFLIDMMCNKLIELLVEKSEFPMIYEEVFAHYKIDESKMFRYARRRNMEDRMKEYLKRNTQVKLRTESKNAD